MFGRKEEEVMLSLVVFGYDVSSCPVDADNCCLASELLLFVGTANADTMLVFLLLPQRCTFLFTVARISLLRTT